MKYVTAEEMKALDRRAIQEYGIPALRLMENAGCAVADEAMRMLKKGDVFVFSGYGNNGGDGFVAARYLAKNNYNVKVFLVGEEKPFSEAARANLDSLKAFNIKPEKIKREEDVDKIFSEIKNPDLVIDAIFGIGIRGSLRSPYMRLIDRINRIGSPIISIDIPSGLDSDTGEAMPCAIKATKTVTLGFPKIGFKNPKAKIYLGEISVADIGLSPER